LKPDIFPGVELSVVGKKMVLMNQENKIKVLFVIDHLAAGGTQNIFINLVKALKKLNYAPTVFSLNGGSKSVIQELRDEGIEVFAFSKYHSLWFWGLPKLLYVIKKNRFSIIQNLLLYSNLIGRVFGRIAGVPIIISSNWGDGHTLKTWEIWLDKLTSRLDDRIVVNSKAGYKYCKKIGVNEEGIELIYNGIEMPQFDQDVNLSKFKNTLHIPEGKIIVGSIGRLSEEKGHRYLLDAFHLAQQEINELFLVIVGSGNQKNNLINQADRLNINDKVVFIDYIRELSLFYLSIDIFVLSSLSEGLPNVVLEAMFYEKPIIASAVGDVPEVIKNNISGLLVSPGNYQEMAEAMKLLARDRNLAGKLTTRSKEKVVGYFSIEKMVSSFDKLYKQSLM
jgi:glycosyltransferase involved in cell wall biosynthesis